MHSRLRIALLVFACALWGCETSKTPYDYAAIRAHPPRSILILPPLNESANYEATYSYLSTVSQPVAERGYYVFPIEVVDLFLKENGMPTSGEMHQAPLGKFAQIIGADAVLYCTVKQYGKSYNVIGSKTVVDVRARLVDTRTETLLWQGQGLAQAYQFGPGGVISEVIADAMLKAMNVIPDPARPIGQAANRILFEDKKAGLPYGPYSPKYEQK